jgi:aryl-alcohol dehydrogenase-like predicted oxidoreductase
MAANARFVARLDALARAHGVTKAQIALAWALARGEDIAPIPGTRSIARLEENVRAADIALSPAEVAALEEAVPPAEIVGERYATGAWTPKK